MEFTPNGERVIMIQRNIPCLKVDSLHLEFCQEADDSRTPWRLKQKLLDLKMQQKFSDNNEKPKNDNMSGTQNKKK